MRMDLYKDPLGKDVDGNEVYLKDIWPTNKEIEEIYSMVEPGTIIYIYA